MKPSYISAFLIGIILSLTGNVKSEETECKNRSCSSLEYPISFGGHSISKEKINFYQLKPPNNENLKWHRDPYFVLKLKSVNGSKLVINEYKLPSHCGGFLGSCNNYLKLSKSLVIPSENILYWSKYKNTFRPNIILNKDKFSNEGILIPRNPLDQYHPPHNLIFEIGYLSNSGEFMQYFISAFSETIPKDSFTSRFLKKLTVLNSGEIISDKKIESILLNLLKNNKKKLTIIQSNIQISKDDKKACIEADETKFPDLIKEYKDLTTTINPLRSKLDLPSSTHIKPICK